MSTILILIFLILFLVLAFKRLDLAVLTTIVALPTYLIRFMIGPIPTTLLEIMILIVFGVWFLFVGQPWKNFKNFKNTKLKKINYPFYLEIILVLIIACASVFTAHLSNSAFGIFKAYFFEPILFFIVLVNIFKNKTDYRKIIWTLSVSAFFVSVLAIFQRITGLLIANPFWANEATRRAVSFFGYPNAVGLYLGPIMILVLGLLFSQATQKSWPSAFLRFTIIISVLAIFSASSFGALVGLTIAIWLGLIIFNKKTRIIILVITVLFGLVVLSVPRIRDPLISKITMQDLSGQIRLRQWTETKLMLMNGKLLSGAGLSGYQVAVAPYHQDGLFFNADKLTHFDERLRNSSVLRAKYWQPVEIYMYPHNIFLNFWTELGLLGMLLFTWIIIKYLYLSAKLFKATKDKNTKIILLSLFSAMIVIIIHGLVDVPYFKNDLSVIFWLLIAILGIINLNELEIYENDSAKINR